MKKHLIVSSLLVLSTVAQAAETRSIKTQEGGNLNVTLQECFRQNEFFVVCNFNLHNPDTDNKAVLLNFDSAQAREGTQVLPTAALALGGGDFNTSPYSSFSVHLPAGVGQLLQVKFQPKDTATELTQVTLYDAVFPVTPLTSEPFTYPVINPQGKELNSLTREEKETAVATCYRLPSKEVHCLVVNRNLGLDLFTVSSERSAVHVITPDGFAVAPFNIAVGNLNRENGDYNTKSVPSKSFLTSYLMFNLPPEVTYLPVLHISGVPFRNIPIEASQNTRRLALPAGAALLDTRNDDYRAVVRDCVWDKQETDWVKCVLTFKSADREKHTLASDGGFAIADDGLIADLSFDEVYQTHEIPADATIDVNVWLKPARKELKSFAYLELAGLVFRNVSVK